MCVYRFMTFRSLHAVHAQYTLSLRTCVRKERKKERKKKSNDEAVVVVVVVMV